MSYTPPEKSPRTKFIIDAYAMYHTPSQIMAMLEQAEEFVDEKPISKTTVANYKVKFAEEIRKRRAEITDSALPILDPAWRLLRYQEIVEEALEGKEALTRKGELIHIKDFKSAITALAQVDKVTGYGKEDDEKESFKKMMAQILEELRVDLIRAGYKPEEVEEVVKQQEEKMTSELVM